MSATLRAARGDDGDACAAIYAPFVRDTAISFEIDPPSGGEMRRRIETTTAQLPWLVRADGGTLLGYAYAARHRARAAYRWSVEVSVYGDPDHHRRGVGRALYTALLGILVEQGFHRALAGITLPNPASVALHERCGFAPMGVYRRVGFKQGEWHDVGWWERGLAQVGGVPKAPRAFAGIAQGPEALRILRDTAAGVRGA